MDKKMIWEVHHQSTNQMVGIQPGHSTRKDEVIILAADYQKGNTL
jgi:hypothetical protein